MKNDRISQTALKVALSLITLSIKDDWQARLPDGLVGISERLLLASGSPGYGPSLMRASKKQWMIKVYEIQDRMIPGQWQGFGHRKIYVDQQVKKAIELGAQQVLVLGAGFDTLCLRLAPQHSDVKFFEVDHPATSAAKAKGIAREGQLENMIQIASDLSVEKLPAVLLQNERWDSLQRSVVVIEGLLQYLTKKEVRDLLCDTAACTPLSSKIILTHAVPGDRKVLQMLLRAVGEPFKSTVQSEDLPAYIQGTGWSVTSDVDHDTAHGIERYAVAERC